MTKKTTKRVITKEEATERRVFDACIQCVSAVSDEIAPLVLVKVQLALIPLGEFNVHRATSGLGEGRVVLFIEDMSPYRFGGTVSLDYKDRPWGKPFVPSDSFHESDHPHTAGRYVLDGIQSKARIQLSAVNESALETLDSLHRAMMFVRVLRDAQLYIDTLLQFRGRQIGEMFLQAIKDE